MGFSKMVSSNLMVPERVVLVDGMNLAYRAQYTNGYLQTSKGVKTGVIYAFLRMLKKIYDTFENAPLVVVWEGGTLQVKTEGTSYIIEKSEPVWRKDLQTKKVYKGNRKITPEVIDAHKQIPHVQHVLNILRYKQLWCPRLEADDLIGIAAHRLQKLDSIKEVAIISNDRDFYQCITDKVYVYRAGKGSLKKITAKSVEKEFGVGPDRWALFKSLVGDSSDHFDGIDGIGPKKAVQLLLLGADPRLTWKEQPRDVKKTFPKLKDSWHNATTCYALAKIPISCKHSIFDKDLQVEAKKAFVNFEETLHRSFLNVTELKKAINLFTSFCGEFEMYAILSDRRKFFEGVVCDGSIVR